MWETSGLPLQIAIQRDHPVHLCGGSRLVAACIVGGVCVCSWSILMGSQYFCLHHVSCNWKSFKCILHHKKRKISIPALCCDTRPNYFIFTFNCNAMQEKPTFIYGNE